MKKVLAVFLLVALLCGCSVALADWEGVDAAVVAINGNIATVLFKDGTAVEVDMTATENDTFYMETVDCWAVGAVLLYRAWDNLYGYGWFNLGTEKYLPAYVETFGK